MSDLGNRKIMARNIQYFMEKNHKSRSDVCSALGVAYTTFTSWVTGAVYPRIDKIELMANYFGIDKADLVEDHLKTIKSNETSNIVTEDERRILRYYRGLNKEGRAKVANEIEIIHDDPAYWSQDRMDAYYRIAKERGLIKD